MNFYLATMSDMFLIQYIAWPLGQLMNLIFEFLNLIKIPNIGVAIFVFTAITKALMIPMSIKQQKSSKLQSIMAPELKAIQAKYKGKTDNASMLAQQQETKEVYAKYGTSAAGGCLQLLIQMPILFALYQVILKLPGYVVRIKDIYGAIADKIMEIPNWAHNGALQTFASQNRVTDPITAFTSLEEGVARNNLIDMMNNTNPTEWQKLVGTVAEDGTYSGGIFNSEELANTYLEKAPVIAQYTEFLGINLVSSPWEQMMNGIWWAAIIPILAGVLQFLSTRLAGAGNTQQNSDDNPMGGSMKIMNYMFPLMSVVFCFMFDAGLGIYWVASSAVQLIIQIFVNMYMNKVDLNEMVRKNVEKANKKRAKQGLKPIKATNVYENAASFEEQKRAEAYNKSSLAEKAQASTEYYQSTSSARPGSLAAKAGMVQQYEERQKAIKAGKKSPKNRKEDNAETGEKPGK